MPASAGSAGVGEPSAGSSFTGSGGGSADVLAAAGSPDQGSAVLGSLGESRAADPGGATLGSLSGADTESGGSQAWGSSALAPLAGAVGAAGSDEPHRTARHWAAGPVNPDEQRDASWARLRALLGEEGEEHPEPGGPDS
jgi:hypothetical protein